MRGDSLSNTEQLKLVAVMGTVAAAAYGATLLVRKSIANVTTSDRSD